MARSAIEINADEVVRDLRRFSDQLQRRIMVRALNRTLTTARKKARSLIRDELNLKARDVNDVLRTRRASGQRQQAILTIEGKPVPLIKYGARQTKRGVTAKVKRRGSRKLVQSAFIATMRSGHKGVFLRRRQERLPIRELFSTAPVQFFDDDRVVNRLADSVRETFLRNLDNEMRFRTQG